ncbi:MAG: type II toxin-antitoxin system VapC family toxin [Verrucomicrobia bacterium]|nr:type II toxin-antitoxin system VapC family toxin [Verrucomicrobiota bacterium]
MLCADTSFLFSLYRRDDHSEEAHAQLSKAAQPLLLSALNEFELGNALRFAECRGLIPPGSARLRLEALAIDHAAGRWRRSEVPLVEIVAEAGRLSDAFTQTGGHRAFDILHVAHARLASPERFLSFDTNQLRLAKAAGVRC